MSMNYDFDLTHNLTGGVVLTIWFDLALVGHTLMYTYVMYVRLWLGWLCSHSYPMDRWLFWLIRWFCYEYMMFIKCCGI